MKVGYFAPLPPARTGVADYAAELLPALRRHGPVEVNARTADIFLYHLGNNQIHRDIYGRALAVPGVVVLHDAVLQHFFLGWLDEAAYVQEFVYNYGEWHRDFAHELWRRRASSLLDVRFWRYPMLKRIAQASRAVVVHNPAAAKIVRDHAPSTPVIEIPHLCLKAGQTPVDTAGDHFLFGVFGYLRESKRLLQILRAFDEVHRTAPNTRLLIAGDFISSDLARTRNFLHRPGIIRMGYLTADRLLQMTAATDACLSLCFPAAGETSGITIRMMGLGKAVMVTSGLETSMFPEAACFRIEPGVAEQAMLSRYMLLLAMHPNLARETGRRAAEHISLNHSPERVAEQYWGVLQAAV